MKEFPFTILFLLLILLSVSCNHNRLKLNQKKLTEEILQAERNESGNLKEQETTRNNSELRKPGVLYKETRSTDPANPLVTIDISGSLNNIADLKLSDVASEIRYVVIDSVPDPATPTDLKFSYHLTNNYIVASNLYGIHLYSMDGRYLRSIVKNEMTGVIVRPDAIIFYTDYTLKGGGITIRSTGDNIYYYYSNSGTGEKCIMKYDCSTIPVTPAYRFDPENPGRISGLGEVAIDLNPDHEKPQNPASHNGMFGGSPEWLHEVNGAFLLSNNLYSIPSDKRSSSFDNDHLITIRNNYGDTLTSFTRFERVHNYQKPLARGTDSDLQYELNGMLYLRPEFNDTVFRVEPPNHLIPVYVLRLGKYKVTMQEGIDPDFDLTGRIIPGEWAETGSFIFFTFAKDGYDCKNSRKNKSVRIYHALYWKQTGKLVVINGDPFNYNPEILENNIDGGVAVWPSFYMMGNKGEILYSLKGREIKERVKSTYFQTSKASSDKKLRLEKLAASVTNNSNILMIIK